MVLTSHIELLKFSPDSDIPFNVSNGAGLTASGNTSCTSCADTPTNASSPTKPNDLHKSLL
jgi:hypothetical protein